MTFDVNALVAEVAATSANMGVAQAGPARELPPEGSANLRFVGYVETGKHKATFEGKEKLEDEVRLVFELSGKNYPPREVEGEKVPHRITLKMNRSLNQKAGFFKLFNRMNYEGKATHMAQLLGNAYRGRVFHGTIVATGDKFLKLRDDTGYTIAPPRAEVMDPETGDVSTVPITVAPALSQLRLFVWGAAPAALKQMWPSIHIAGSYGEGANQRSANVFQDRIKAAVNYQGSPIQQLLECGGEVADIPDAESGKAGTSGDPLDDVA